MSRGIITVSIALLLFLADPLLPQETAESLMAGGRYSEALKVISAELDGFYSSRMAETRIPENFITLTETREEANLLEMFRKLANSLSENEPDPSAILFEMLIVAALNCSANL